MEALSGSAGFALTFVADPTLSDEAGEGGAPGFVVLPTEW